MSKLIEGAWKWHGPATAKKELADSQWHRPATAISISKLIEGAWKWHGPATAIKRAS